MKKNIKKIVIYIVLLEILNVFFGIFNYGKNALLPYTGFNDPPQYYDMDSLYGVTRYKHTTQLVNHPWGSVVSTINSLGFRDEEFDSNGVLIVGNSFIEGFGLNNEDRFSDILQKKLDVPVHNAGSGGVWTPIQGVVLLEYLLKEKNMKFDKVVFVMTPGEVINIGKRNPQNDSGRNYPYKKDNEIVFHKSKHKSFGAELSLINKIKRFSKSLLVFKMYNFFKYYGAARKEKKELDYKKENLDWLLTTLEAKNFDQEIEVVILNNLGSIFVKDLKAYQNPTQTIQVKVLEFPDGLDNYFVSNGHLNEKGNEVLAEMLEPICKD